MRGDLFSYLIEGLDPQQREKNLAEARAQGTCGRTHLESEAVTKSILEGLSAKMNARSRGRGDTTTT